MRIICHSVEGTARAFILLIQYCCGSLIIVIGIIADQCSLSAVPADWRAGPAGHNIKRVKKLKLPRLIDFALGAQQHRAMACQIVLREAVVFHHVSNKKISLSVLQVPTL